MKCQCCPSNYRGGRDSFSGAWRSRKTTLSGLFGVIPVKEIAAWTLHAKGGKWLACFRVLSYLLSWENSRHFRGNNQWFGKKNKKTKKQVVCVIIVQTIFFNVRKNIVICRETRGYWETSPLTASLIHLSGQLTQMSAGLFWSSI